MKRPFLITIGVVVLVTGLGLIGTQFAILPPSIEVVRPYSGPAVEAVYATGTVESSVMVPIAPRTGARLMELNADEGSRVEKDAVLARLEDADLQKTLQEVQARADYAAQEYQRQLALNEKRVASRNALDQAKADLGAANASVDRVKAQIDFMKLIAPASGTIIRRDGEIGELIPANQPVFWMSCCAPLRITAEVDEEDISAVQPGQKVLIRADAFPGQVFNGKVQSITPKGDPVARSYRVRIALDGETPLLIGMTAETNIILHEASAAMLVPATALLNGQNIWVVRQNMLQRISPSIGAKTATEVEIKEGLSPEDEVVISPSTDLKEGQRVRPHLLQPEKKS